MLHSPAAGVIDFLKYTLVCEGASFHVRSVCRSPPVCKFLCNVVGFSASGLFKVMEGIEIMHVERNG